MAGVKSGTAYGRARISGAVVSRALVHKRDTVKTAVQCLKVLSHAHFTDACPAMCASSG